MQFLARCQRALLPLSLHSGRRTLATWGPPVQRHTLFLSTEDLREPPGAASGECGNNRPERRKRLIFDAIQQRCSVVDTEASMLPITSASVCGVHDEGEWLPQPRSHSQASAHCSPRVANLTTHSLAGLLTIFSQGWPMFEDLVHRVGRVPYYFTIPRPTSEHVTLGRGEASKWDAAFRASDAS